MAEVTELVTKFSFAGSLTPLLTFNKGMAGAIKTSALFTAAMAGATVATLKWSSGILQTLDPLAQMEKRTGIAAGRIQELNFMASQSGSDFGTMQSSLLSLSQTIGDAAIKGSEDFSRLGISVRDATGQVKNADVILGEVGDRFKELNLSMMEQESIAGALGIDASLVQMLNRSSGEMAELSKQARELGTLTAGQTEQIIAYNDALHRQQFAISAVKNQIAIGLAPTMVDLTDGFTKLVSENKEWITDVATKTIDVAVEIGDAIKNTLVFIWDFTDAITGGHAALALLVAAGTALVVTNPVLAAIAATVLVVDDLVTAFQGGQSVIADFFEEFFGINIVPIIQDIIDKTTELLELFGILEGNTTPGEAWDPSSPDLIPAGFGSNALVESSRNVQITNETTIEVKTNDPAAAATAIRDSLQNQLDDTAVQLSVGGR